jgi:hypothetical protein
MEPLQPAQAVVEVGLTHKALVAMAEVDMAETMLEEHHQQEPQTQVLVVEVCMILAQVAMVAQELLLLVIQVLQQKHLVEP